MTLRAVAFVHPDQTLQRLPLLSNDMIYSNDNHRRAGPFDAF